MYSLLLACRAHANLFRFPNFGSRHMTQEERRDDVLLDDVWRTSPPSPVARLPLPVIIAVVAVSLVACLICATCCWRLILCCRHERLRRSQEAAAAVDATPDDPLHVTNPQSPCGVLVLDDFAAEETLAQATPVQQEKTAQTAAKKKRRSSVAADAETEAGERGSRVSQAQLDCPMF